MFNLYISVFYVFLRILDVRTNELNNKSTTASNILDKLHQSDYKIHYEWSETVRIDKRIIEYYKHTFKYNRTTTAANVTIIPHIHVGYNIEVIVQAYKFASNEYRLFPLRFQFNLCEAMTKNSMGFEKFSTNGNFSCPILKGKRYYYYNWTPEDANFPPFVPTGRYMMESQFMYNDKEVLCSRDYGAIERPFM